VILGTAGHIDHGKTALVKALTGVDTDRLPEEKRRGITIDLGFAPLALEGVGTIGIVDVPGHEAFVRTMLAGASGIDIALLVVAADEGVMPQTREHLEILSLLGIPKALVALTKCDLVTDEWIALATDDVRGLLAGTHYADSRIVPVSAVTGLGLPELRAAIANAASSDRVRAVEDDVFRMPVDRAFTVRGTGTVVTGTVWSGTIGRDATVTVFPPGKESRVRGIQHHSAAAKVGRPGQRVALALSDLDVGEVGRGSVVVADSPWPPTSRIEAEVRITSDAVDIGPRTRLRFHLGTSDVGARISRRRVDDAGDDEKTFVALVVLEEPLLVRGGDRFVLRLPSPPSTIGGGVVGDPFPSARRRRGGRLADQSTGYSGIGKTALERLAWMAEDAGLDGLAGDILPIRLGVSPRDGASFARELGLLEIQRRFYDPRVLAALEADIEAMVLKHVGNFPLEAGVQLQSVRSAVPARDAVVDRAIGRLVERGRIELDRSLARPIGWSPRLSDRERVVVEAILHEICIRPNEPPALSELVASFGEKAPVLLRYLERAGELVRVSDDRYYSPAAVEAMVEKLRSTLEPRRAYSPAELRDVLGVSRKYLIPFLEFCDASGVTDRKTEGRMIAASGTVPGRL
jgi:selenocysteine-specific elongation factor